MTLQGIEQDSSTRSLRLFRTVERWANAGWATSVVFGWGLLQGAIVPGLADAVFLPLALARPQHAYRLALAAAAGNIAGSITLYWVGALAIADQSGSMASWLGVGAEDMSRMHELLDRYGWFAILASTLSPISAKLTSVASGAFDVPFASFALALSVGRLSRVLFIAYLVRHGGARRLARWLKVPEGTTSG